MDPSPPALEYSPQPPGSRAICEYGADGSVTVRIPPVLQRTIGRIALVSGIVGSLLGGAGLALADADAVSPMVAVLSGIVFAPSISAVGITLWMGCRWTIIRADDRGLALELDGLLGTRQRSWPRHEIGGLRKGISLYVLDPAGRTIGKIDATDPKEEIWLMHVLSAALKLPAP